jgi:hypothetical protein
VNAVSKFEIKPGKLQKVQGGAALQSAEDHDPIEMIVKVEEDHYVPTGVKVRGRIDATMFTGEASRDVLDRLEQDPKVTSVSVSRPLRIIE